MRYDRLSGSFSEYVRQDDAGTGASAQEVADPPTVRPPIRTVG
jgi:hypothetical protein